MNPPCLKFIKNEFREIDATMRIMVKMVNMVKMVIMVVMVIMVAKVIMVTNCPTFHHFMENPSQRMCTNPSKQSPEFFKNGVISDFLIWWYNTVTIIVCFYLVAQIKGKT